MKRLSVLVALSVALLAPTGAAASPFTPELQADYTAALAWWGVPAPPQCATLTMELLPTDPLVWQDGAQGAARATQPEPGAYVPCILYVFEDKMRERQGCPTKIVVRHEVGHLLGLGHSTDPDDIMFPVFNEELWCGPAPEYTSAELRREWRSWRKERLGCHRERDREWRHVCFRELRVTAHFLRSLD